MKVIDINNNIRCELGVCRARATHAVTFDRTGPRGRIYMCDKCMDELFSALAAARPAPRSVETAKKRTGKGGAQ